MIYGSELSFICGLWNWYYLGLDYECKVRTNNCSGVTPGFVFEKLPRKRLGITEGLSLGVSKIIEQGSFYWYFDGSKYILNIRMSGS